MKKLTIALIHDEDDVQGMTDGQMVELPGGLRGRVITKRSGRQGLVYTEERWARYMSIVKGN